MAVGDGGGAGDAGYGLGVDVLVVLGIAFTLAAIDYSIFTSIASVAG